MLLHRHFIRVAKKYGKKTAFIDRTADKEVTYERALIASLILSRKFRKYDKGFIGIMIPTSVGSALAIIGALMSGRTPVMINYSTGAEDNALYALKKCNFKTIITSKKFLEKINCEPVEGMVFLEDIMESISAGEKIKAALVSKLPVQLVMSMVHKGSMDDDMVILFTSGSEKDPKAVELTHRNISSNIKSFSEAISLTDKDTMFSILPFFHVFGFTVNLWTPLYLGMTAITYANPLDFASVCDIAREYRPTVIAATPSFLWGYVRKSQEGDFKSLRLTVAGADKCPDALRQAFAEKHGMTLLEGYGTTETSPAISVNTPENNRPGSIGKVIPGVEVRIENYETGEECKTGEAGRIMIKGDLVMKGYFDDIEETAMRIRQGWYDTGDMGYLDEDGYLWHSGRLKRFVKIGGEMVSLVKVENVLEGVLPQDVECCVVEIPDPIKGARIVVAVTHEIDEKKTVKQMSASLPNIAIPKSFIVLEELPKMGSGKIDFRGVTSIVQETLQ
ncbi:MAG: AMP-binding protein [Thermodesulfovibrionales bacterium]